MNLKLDENGVPELKDSKPVYAHDDGEEFAADVPAPFAKISALNEEARDRRLAVVTAAPWYILGPTKVALEITETGEDVPEELARVTGKENVNHRDLGEFDFSAAPPHSLSAVVSMRRRTGWQLRGPRGTQALPLGSPSESEGPGVPC
ncbi:MAG: hypothetical protein HN849_16690 [Victivallales bacterium]|nr:hypothetical protein [Victivallales bacterium]MBT7301160.1 hypothetical protein [Victivallales bacterium]